MPAARQQHGFPALRSAGRRERASAVNAELAEIKLCLESQVAALASLIAEQYGSLQVITEEINDWLIQEPIDRRHHINEAVEQGSVDVEQQLQLVRTSVEDRTNSPATCRPIGVTKLTKSDRTCKATSRVGRSSQLTSA